MMLLTYSNLNASDLRGSSLADVLAAVEANFWIDDNGSIIYEEPYFPVAELAWYLHLWIASEGRDEFVFDSMSFDEPGAVFVSRGQSGWIFGSRRTSEVRTSPISWVEVEKCVKSFVTVVRQDLERLNIELEWSARDGR